MSVTKEDLDKLPRWAIVAFAARCARRVQPLFTALWPVAPQEHVHAGPAMERTRLRQGRQHIAPRLRLMTPFVIDNDQHRLAE